jgi:hypothetical protein
MLALLLTELGQFLGCVLRLLDLLDFRHGDIYRLRQKESLGSVKQKLVRKIQQNESAFCFEDLVREALEAV